MNTTKKINVNISSLVGLKAELLRKHTEVKDAKARSDMSKPVLPKAKVKSRKDKVKNDGEKKKIKVTEIEDVETLKKSKYMLIAKSKLYDKLKKNRGEGNDNYLVDFKSKNYESSEDESPVDEDDYEDPNIDPEEDWIDYEDCFGRTRRCLRKDLPRMKEKDSLIEREITKKSHPEEREERIQPPPIIPPEKESEIEVMRKKWEQQTEKLAQKSDIHYQDILFDEARTHGVGYYAFAHDEDERAKQQSNLAKLRKETEQKQKEMQEIKDLKSKMEENRLKTARIRARIRAGLPAEPTEEEIKNDPSKPVSTSTKESSPEPKSPKKDNAKKDIGKAVSNDEDSLMVIEDKIKAFGELLGKRMPWRELSQEEWVDKRRKDRQGEFAPVYDNFKSVGMLMTTKHNQLGPKANDDPLQIRAGGPEPTDFWESSAAAYREDDGPNEGLNNSDKISTSEQTIIPMNCTESYPFIHSVPPPDFNPAIPPPPVVSIIPPSPISDMNTNFIPSLPVLHPIPPPPFTNSFAPIELYISSSPFSSNSLHPIPDMSNAEANQKTSVEVSSNSDSNDSDIIGPMPPPPLASIQDEVLAQIPLPENSAPTKIQDFSTNLSETKVENQSGNPNIDKIAAGLRYLRRKFETNDNS